MTTKKISIIVCARVDSNRLPAKVLKWIGRKRAIDILLEHVIQYGKYEVILAIPANSRNDILETIGKEYPIKIYRGEDDSPLHRMTAVANKYGLEYVIRNTADDIFIDQDLLGSQVKWTIDTDLDYTYIGRCPEGIACEVIRTSKLNEIVKKVNGKPTEFISYLLKNENTKYREFYPDKAYQYPIRLTLDYPEDLQLIRIIDNNLAPGYTTLDIINYVKRNKYLLNLNMQPKVTVYITNYNYSDHVIDAICSVMKQTFKEWELIIFDDCSTDDSVKRIVTFLSFQDQAIRKKVQIYANERNMGLPWTCNLALTKAKGRYILRLDADDMLLENALEIMVNCMNFNKEVNGIFASYNEIDDNGRMITVKRNTDKHPGCCLLTKSCVNEIKYRDDLNYFEGLEFLQRFESLYVTKTIPEVLWNYRRHNGQKTDAKNSKERELTLAKVKECGKNQ
jgi:spore coat polysaccharide biosynthesis protein SpsF (cytidylyltransferase family)